MSAIAVNARDMPARVEPVAFESFYEDSKDAVLRAVVVARRDPDGAEDATAEAFTRAYERWDSVSRMASPTAWVVRVAINAHTSWWRRARRLLPLSRADDRGGPAWAGSPDPEMAESVLRLPVRQRQVLALRILAGLSTRETAEALGIAEGTVTAHLHRAVASLRADLSSTEDRRHG